MTIVIGSSRTFMTKRRTSSLVGIGADIKALREAMGLGQTAFACLIDTDQANVPRWEKEQRPVPISAVIKIAEIAPEDQRSVWRKRAGFQTAVDESTAGEGSEMSLIKVLKDPIAAGQTRRIDPSNVDCAISLPKSLFPRGSELIGLRIKGDSMAPILETGFIVIVDLKRTDPSKLINRMVVARDADGTTVKWLRQRGGHYLLVPENTKDFVPEVIAAGSDFRVVGEVVKWIGEPPRRK